MLCRNILVFATDALSCLYDICILVYLYMFVVLCRHTLGLNRWFKIIVTNWTCLVRYFQNYVPSTERGVRKSPRFQRIHSTLSNPFTLLRLWFFRSIGNTLEDFIFNSIGTEGSSVHLIFKGSSSLIKDIGGKPLAIIKI